MALYPPVRTARRRTDGSFGRPFSFRSGSRLSSGFTLVELLVVIGIIALLVSILMPALQKAKEQSIRVQCASNLRQWGISLRSYAADNRNAFPVNYDPWGYSQGLSWVGPNVIDFMNRYLMPLGDLQNNAAVRNPSHVTYCPTQDWHRVYSETMAGMSTNTQLVGYFYLPHRDLTSLGHAGNDYSPAGTGWVTKKKFGGPDRFAPIMSDMIQGIGSQWGGYGAPFPSHLNLKADKNRPHPSYPGQLLPPVAGANFLFEDGHIEWHIPGDIGVGAHIGGWQCYYKIQIHQP